eukprot:g680.t1
MMPLFGATWGTPADLTGQSNKENASTNNPGNILLQQMTQRATKAAMAYESEKLAHADAKTKISEQLVIIQALQAQNNELNFRAREALDTSDHQALLKAYEEDRERLHNEATAREEESAGHKRRIAELEAQLAAQSTGASAEQGTALEAKVTKQSAQITLLAKTLADKEHALWEQTVSTKVVKESLAAKEGRVRSLESEVREMSAAKDALEEAKKVADVRLKEVEGMRVRAEMRAEGLQVRVDQLEQAAAAAVEQQEQQEQKPKENAGELICYEASSSSVESIEGHNNSLQDDTVIR